MERFKKLMLKNYNNPRADRFIVSSQVEDRRKEFGDIKTAVKYAVKTLDYKTFITDKGYFKSVNRKKSPPMQILNNVDHEDLFQEYDLILNLD